MDVAPVYRVACQCSPTCEHLAQPDRLYALGHTPAQGRSLTC